MADKHLTPDDQSLLVDVNVACRMLSISRAKFFEARASGQFAPAVLKMGRKLLMRRWEIVAWVDAGMPPRRQWHWKGARQ